MKLYDLLDDPSYRHIEVDIRAWPATYRDRGAVELIGRAIAEHPSEPRDVYALELHCEKVSSFMPCRPAPLCILEPAVAKMLMDSLWAAGIRPSDGEGSVGQLGAVERHLADMREIAFAKINVHQPGRKTE
jgi:hypothetical protein